MDQKAIELYCCSFAPPLIPQFVDPHITVDEVDGNEVYIIEVRPNHPDALQVKATGKTIKQVLEELGFVGLELFYSGEPLATHSH